MGAKRKLVAGLASLTLFDIAAATAADLPLKARPLPLPVVYNWTGLYVGAHAGYRWADAEFTSAAYQFGIPFPARSHRFSLDGGIVGGHLGYNVMLSPTILAGIEGDWTWGSKRSSANLVFFEGFALSEVELQWQATIRGRLGWVNGPWLFYGTGGVAFIHAKWNDSVTVTLGPVTDGWSYSKTKTGWVIGAGVEHMIKNPNWLVRAEYLYENFGSFDVPHGFSTSSQTGTLNIGDVHKLRVGISYKFGSGR